MENQLRQWVYNQGGIFYRRINNETYQEMTEEEKSPKVTVALRTKRMQGPQLPPDKSKYVQRPSSMTSICKSGMNVTMTTMGVEHEVHE